MQTITIHGRRTLHGSIRPAAAKNSTLPLLAATLLCDGPCRLRDVPRLADVDTSLALLDAVGARVRRCGADLCTRPADRLCGDIPEHLACRCPGAAASARGPWTSTWPGWPPWGPRSNWRASPSRCGARGRCMGWILHCGCPASGPQ